MRNRTFGPIRFLTHFARVRRNLLMRHPSEIRGLNERRLEVNGIVEDHGDRQDVAVPDPVFSLCREVTLRKAILLDVALFEMSRRYLQHVSDPFSGGETNPRVWRRLRRMRTTVHVNNARSRALTLRVYDARLNRDRIDFFPDTNAARAAPAIEGIVRPALPFRQSERRREPRIRSHASGGVDGISGIIAEIGPGAAIRVVFMQ